MGGINCGNSNGRVIKNDIYRLAYASYSKYLFKCFERFYYANSLVEEFTLAEINDTDEALVAYKGALVGFQEAITYLRSAQESLDRCYDEIVPLFKFSRLKNGAIGQYRKFDDSFAKTLFEKEGVVTSEVKVWESVINSLKNGGEIEYLVYQQQEMVILKNILQSLLEEYIKLEQAVRQGVAFVSMRDIDVDVTPLTAMALTKISEITSSLTYLCLVEYSAHTSISGKNIEIFDLLPKSSNGELQYQQIN